MKIIIVFILGVGIATGSWYYFEKNQTEKSKNFARNGKAQNLIAQCADYPGPSTSWEIQVVLNPAQAGLSPLGPI